MPKNNVTDPITDQEIAFARLVLAGTMTDRRAAEAVGLDPGSAAYTKSKPRVRAYMLEHRAAVQQQLVQQEAQQLCRLNLGREQVLARLWEIANLSPEMTRGSITGQVKALSMIVAIQGLIPDRRALSSENKSAPPPTKPNIYVSAWRRKQEAETVAPQPTPSPAQGEQEPERGSAADAPPDPPPSQSTFANRVSPLEDPPLESYAPVFASAPDTRVPFSTRRNPLSHRR